MNKVIFYLMGEKGFFVLLNFINLFGSSLIDYIVVSSDKDIKKDYHKEIVKLCLDKKIKFFKKNDKIPKSNNYKFAIGWRWIIKDSLNLIVLHDSILPKYRGFAPLVNMLINGEKTIGVTALFASRYYDRGRIIMQKKIKINYPIKIQDAIIKILPLYFELVESIYIEIYNNKTIISFPQLEKDASYSLWRNFDDYFINWHNKSSTIKRSVDALSYPYDGAKAYIDKKLITIDDTIELPDLKIENRCPGKIIFIEDKKPIVVCGKGLLKIITAKYCDGKSIFPLNSFRIRFK